MTDAAMNVHQRLAAVMQEVQYIQKEKKPGMNYTVVPHDVVTGKVRPALLKAGVIYYPVRCEYAHQGNRAECAMTVRFANIDDPADHIDVPTFGYGVDGQDKGPGKAMSYAVKYALLKALGLETGDDPENESIDHSREDPAVPPPGAVRDRLKGVVASMKTLPALGEAWKNMQADLKALPEPMQNEVTAAKDAWKKELTGPDPAMQAPQDGHVSGAFAHA